MELILITLLMTHLTIASVTLYLHRCQAHRGVEFHPVLCHAMRFWLWLTTGMTTKQWVLEVYPNLTPAKALEYLIYYKERKDSGSVFPKTNYLLRSSSKQAYPRPRIRRTA
jgi:hypothetical protein